MNDTISLPREVPKTFTLPDTTDGIVDCLRSKAANTDALWALVTAEEWTKAALVAALIGSPQDAKARQVRNATRTTCTRHHPADCWSDDDGCSRRALSKPPGMSIPEAEALRIPGVCGRRTLLLYRDRWCDGDTRPAPSPGSTISLDGLPEWEPIDRWHEAAKAANTASADAPEPESAAPSPALPADAPVEEVAEVVREALARPEVARVVMDDYDTARAVRRAENETPTLVRHRQGYARQEREQEARASEMTPILTPKDAMLTAWEVQRLMGRAEEANRDDMWREVMTLWVDFITRQAAYATALLNGEDLQIPEDMDGALQRLLDREEGTR